MVSLLWANTLWRVGARTSPVCRGHTQCRCWGYLCALDRSSSASSWWPTSRPSWWTSSTRPPTTYLETPSMTWWSQWTSRAWWCWPPSTSQCPPPSPAPPTSSRWRPGSSLTSPTLSWLSWSTSLFRQSLKSPPSAKTVFLFRDWQIRRIVILSRNSASGMSKMKKAFILYSAR